MLRSLVSLALLFAAASVSAEIIGQPTPATNVSVTLEAEIAPSSGADSYTVAWVKNGVAQIVDTIPAASLPADGKVQKTLPNNANGDLLCVRVSAVNAGGETAQDQSCITVSLPAIPAQPFVLSLVTL